MAVTITGSSDDLIEIDGDVQEEWGCYTTASELQHIAFSDGTVVSIIYEDGIWRVNLVFQGRCQFSKVNGVEADDTFDIATLTGETIKWALLGSKPIARR